jgi:hypothetical protein
LLTGEGGKEGGREAEADDRKKGKDIYKSFNTLCCPAKGKRPVPFCEFLKSVIKFRLISLKTLSLIYGIQLLKK